MLEFDPDNVEWIGLDPIVDDDEDLDVEIMQSKPARAKHTLNLDIDVEASCPKQHPLDCVMILMIWWSTCSF